MKIFLLAKLRHLPVFRGFTQILVFFGHVCMVILDVILMLSHKVLFRQISNTAMHHAWRDMILKNYLTA